ncbi:MAG: Rieske (2Fe-2S) protein [Bacteroidia bacterium]|nr:Rieske (2Fe-2S) protein [Bacteroidia bacterium]
MKRNEFLTALGISASTVVFAPYLVSCSKGSSLSDSGNNGTPSATIDFTLDLTMPANSALNTNGSSMISNGVIVAKTSGGMYIAVASKCTHQGYTLAYDNATSEFHCASHGSNFTTTGLVVNGPAATSLKVYKTQLTGTTLRVYS